MVITENQDTWRPFMAVGFFYFSEVLIVPKLVLSLVPTPWTAAMIAIAMPLR
jgi:hypothetical protein